MTPPRPVEQPGEAEPTAASLNEAGIRLLALGRAQEAEASFRRAIALDPGLAEPYHNLGVLMQADGRLALAAGSYEAALARCPELVGSAINLANVLAALGRTEAAIGCLEAALAHDSRHVAALNNLANLLARKGAFERAFEAFGRALEIEPENAQLYFNLANTLAECRARAAALAAYDDALALQPDYAEAHLNRGILLQALGRTAAAENAFERAAALAPRLAEAHYNFGSLRKNRGDTAAALAAFERALEFSTGHGQELCALLHQLQYACDWRRVAELGPRLDRLTEQALAQARRPGEAPFVAVARNDDPARLHALARAWAEDVDQRTMRLGRRLQHQHRRRPKRRLTIGYLSGDFRDHPVSHVMLDILPRHDRARLRLVGYAYGHGRDPGHREMIRACLDDLVDLDDLADQAAAARIAADEVDILVDLTGHTRDGRLALCAMQPAPIQVGYLGFPGTSGADFIDYLIADRTVCPADQDAHYSEAIVRLPASFMAGPRFEPTTIAPRDALGLPPRSVVLCCFNAAFKLDERSVALWMRILARAPESVLWLGPVCRQAARNLRAMARCHGVDPSRLVFAERLPRPAHIARLAAADLALDPLTFNGGVTTLDALRAGVPVLCKVGRQFASRMAASLVRAAGLAELVASDDQGYEALAVELIRDRARLLALQQRLRTAPAPLFDTSALARDLEAAYQWMWDSFTAGRPPAAIEL